jgi:hypothetical protein
MALIPLEVSLKSSEQTPAATSGFPPPLPLLWRDLYKHRIIQPQPRLGRAPTAGHLADRPPPGVCRETPFTADISHRANLVSSLWKLILTMPKRGRNDEGRQVSPTSVDQCMPPMHFGYIASHHSHTLFRSQLCWYRKRPKETLRAHGGGTAYQRAETDFLFDLLFAFLQLIVDPDMTLLMAIADIGLPKRDVEHFARAIVYIHCQRGTDMLPVLNLLLAEEVNTHGTLTISPRIRCNG